MTGCSICPRGCRANRAERRGFCGVGDEILISKIMLHRWEEPCISGERGSGAIFFCGCPLRCSICQNRPISHGEGEAFEGQRVYSAAELTEAMLKLQADGAHNVNLVSPTQYAEQIKGCVADARDRGLNVPVVWNTGGYEVADTIRSLKGCVDIFLTDVKYYSRDLSRELSGAEDYFDRAFEALLEMVRITGATEYGDDGVMKRGVIIRHLVLPGCRRDSADILNRLAEAGLQDKAVLSLMSQYTPDFFTGCSDPRLDRAMRRRVTTFEYEYVRDLADTLGFNGYGQDRSSAVSKYTPEWE